MGRGYIIYNIIYYIHQQENNRTDHKNSKHTRFKPPYVKIYCMVGCLVFCLVCCLVFVFYEGLTPELMLWIMSKTI